MTNVLLILVALRTVVFTQKSAVMIEMLVPKILAPLLPVVLILESPVTTRMLVLKTVAALFEDVSQLLYLAMMVMPVQVMTVTPLLDVPINKSTVTTITNVLLTAALNS
jgi:hypothetical protein